MSNLVKIILAVALAIFVVGFIWAIVVAVKRPDETPVVENNPPKVETPVTTAEPLPDPIEETDVQPEVVEKPVTRYYPQPTRPRTTTTRQTTIVEHEIATDASAEGDAWARSGVDENGNAYAEAHAN